MKTIFVYKDIFSIQICILLSFSEHYTSKQKFCIHLCFNLQVQVSNATCTVSSMDADDYAHMWPVISKSTFLQCLQNCLFKWLQSPDIVLWNKSKIVVFLFRDPYVSFWYMTSHIKCLACLYVSHQLVLTLCTAVLHKIEFIYSVQQKDSRSHDCINIWKFGLGSESPRTHLSTCDDLDLTHLNVRRS